MAKAIRMVGMRFGRLVVVSNAGRSPNGQYRWICQCDCGQTTKPIDGSNLRRGVIKSCGCFRRELSVFRGSLLNKSHGMCATRIYKTWSSMKSRCYNANIPNFERYGGRGITVCDEWLNSFEAFYEWAMANGYADNLTIDRIDVNGNYCPENCRWVTIADQNRNKRNTTNIEINGKSQTISQWAKESGIPKTTLFYRYKHGCSGEDLIHKEKSYES